MVRAGTARFPSKPAQTLSALFDSLRNSSVYMVYTISLHMFIRLWCFLLIGIVIGSIISVYIPRRRLSSLT